MSRIDEYSKHFQATMVTLNDAEAKVRAMTEDLGLLPKTRAQARVDLDNLLEEEMRLRKKNNAYLFSLDPGVNEPSADVIARTLALTQDLANVLVAEAVSTKILAGARGLVAAWTQIIAVPQVAAVAPVQT